MYGACHTEGIKSDSVQTIRFDQSYGKFRGACNRITPDMHNRHHLHAFALEGRLKTCSRRGGSLEERTTCTQKSPQKMPFRLSVAMQAAYYCQSDAMLSPCPMLIRSPYWYWVLAEAAWALCPRVEPRSGAPTLRTLQPSTRIFLPRTPMTTLLRCCLPRPRHPPPSRNLVWTWQAVNPGTARNLVWTLAP